MLRVFFLGAEVYASASRRPDSLRGGGGLTCLTWDLAADDPPCPPCLVNVESVDPSLPSLRVSLFELFTSG